MEQVLLQEQSKWSRSLTHLGNRVYVILWRGENMWGSEQRAYVLRL